MNKYHRTSEALANCWNYFLQGWYVNYYSGKKQMWLLPLKKEEKEEEEELGGELIIDLVGLIAIPAWIPLQKIKWFVSIWKLTRRLITVGMVLLGAKHIKQI